MKFIGQYIQDFIARFRSDVYLEDVSTGTIASGGNLGLDSNNKIVKADVPADGDITTITIGDTTTTSPILSGDATVQFLAGEGVDVALNSVSANVKQITYSGEDASTSNKGVASFSSDNFAASSGEITIKSGGVDLTDEVTGVLPVGNTAAKVTSVIAGDGIDVDSTTGDVTVTAETASATNPGVVELATTAETTTGTDTTRAVTPDGLKDGYQGSTNVTTLGSIATGVWRGTAIDQAYLSGQSGTNTGDEPDADATTKGIVELATTAEATTGTDTSRAVTAAGVAAVHATAQTGKNYRIINTSFRQDIGTTKYYLPFKSQDENVTVHREEVSELAVCDGRVVSITLRVENLDTHSGDANVTFGVTTNVVGSAYATFTEQEPQTLAINNLDDHHLFHYVFDNAKHWDSTDMFAISIQSDTDISGSNERFYITVVIEDDWSTYLAGSSREIDSTP